MSCGRISDDSLRPEAREMLQLALPLLLNGFQQKCFAWNANRKKANGSTFVDKETFVPTALPDVRCWETKRERFPWFTLCSLYFLVSLLIN
jgi:hypothetical protein